MSNFLDSILFDADNTHEVNPATGQPWPIEPLCCSYHFPTERTVLHGVEVPVTASGMY